MQPRARVIIGDLIHSRIIRWGGEIIWQECIFNHVFTHKNMLIHYTHIGVSQPSQTIHLSIQQMFIGPCARHCACKPSAYVDPQSRAGDKQLNGQRCRMLTLVTSALREGCRVLRARRLQSVAEGVGSGAEPLDPGPAAR